LIVSQGEGPLAAPDASGDEPYLLAQKLPGVSVLVGKDRRVTGRLAVDALSADSIILDDGFQYQRLHRDVDIVLVDALLPFGYDALVPRGLLREPPGHLGRADAVWITHCDLVPPKDVDAVRDRVAALAPEARIWETIHAPIRLRRLGDGEEAEPAALRGRRVCALSGLGNPAAFESTLTALGAEIAGVARFPDHHRYGVDELRETAALQAAEAEWIVTTEKDAVRLPKCELAKPLWVLEIALAGWRKDASLAEEMTCLLRAKSRS
jgi:tetraacyldisaccharide 4'-kinase